MHALFHIKTVIIPRTLTWGTYRSLGMIAVLKTSGRYRCLGMITFLIWKMACIDLFITYFNIELKRTKLNSHTDTKLLNMSDRYWLRDDNSPGMEKGMHSSMYYISQHWIKKNKINVPHRHQTYGYEWSIMVQGW